MYPLIFKWLVVCFVTSVLGCKDSDISQKLTAKTSTDRNYRFENMRSIINGQYKLEMITSFINDTLSGEWEDEIYGTPLVEKQRLVFFESGIIGKIYFLPLERIWKTAKRSPTVSIARTPILEICLIKSQRQDFYCIYGADFCNGVECPEFYGIYSMDGLAIYEGITTIGPLSEELFSLDSILNTYQIDLNKTDTCQSILNVWNKSVRE